MNSPKYKIGQELKHRIYPLNIIIINYDEESGYLIGNSDKVSEQSYTSEDFLDGEFKLTLKTKLNDLLDNV